MDTACELTATQLKYSQLIENIVFSTQSICLLQSKWYLVDKLIHQLCVFLTVFVPESQRRF